MSRNIERFLVFIDFLIPTAALIYFRTTLHIDPCDDAYITLKTAENLACGNGMVFNIGEKIYVVTTPLWVFLIVLVRMLTQDVVIAVKFLGAAFEVLLLWSMVYLGQVVTGSRRIGMIAAVLMVTNPVFLLTSFMGMELPMYLFLMTLSFILLAKERYIWSLLVAALSVWTRIDGLLVYVVVLGWIVYAKRFQITKTPLNVIAAIIPSILVIIAYLLFGLLYYGDIVPISAQRKLEIGPDLFSSTWLSGVLRLAFNFIVALAGKSTCYYRLNTPLWLILIPFVGGLIAIRRHGDRRIIPLLSYTVLYIILFLASGNPHATGYPWYFTIILPAGYLIIAMTIMRILPPSGTDIRASRSNNLKGNVALVFGIVWIFIMLMPMHNQAKKGPGEVAAKREKTYATATVWLNHYLKSGSEITSNEIGTIGFFSRNDITILDMFGILRVKEERFATDMELVRSHQPEAVLAGSFFQYKRRIQEEIGTDFYTWFVFKDLDIGLRSDIAPQLVERMEELERIYETIDLNREFHAGRFIN